MKYLAVNYDRKRKIYGKGHLPRFEFSAPKCSGMGQCEYIDHLGLTGVNRWNCPLQMYSEDFSEIIGIFQALFF